MSIGIAQILASKFYFPLKETMVPLENELFQDGNRKR
jgi:hypothetical protein